MRRTEKETKELVIKWAYEYAESGEFSDYVMIENKLKDDGYSEARTILDDEYIRKSLNEICNNNHTQGDL